MLNPLQIYIKTNQLFNPTDKILLTVSGGKDSVVLFDLFCKANFNFGVAHCNFQLRGEESDGDEEFVKQLAHNQDITFHSTRFETKKYATEQGISTQMAARNLRYEWFEKLRTEFGYNYIATAHHLNDNIETILLNLTKGTGIAGIRGIQPKNGHIIRPLLFATRDEIEKYVSDNKLTWREDSSNASTDYQRNLLRHEVIPILKKINPNLEETFSRNIERFQALEIDFQKNLNYFKATVLREEGDTTFIKIENLKYWQSTSYLLEELLKDYGFNYQQVKEIEKSLTKHSGKTFISPTHTLVKDREELIITKNDEELNDTFFEISPPFFKEEYPFEKSTFQDFSKGGGGSKEFQDDSKAPRPPFNHRSDGRPRRLSSGDPSLKEGGEISVPSNSPFQIVFTLKSPPYTPPTDPNIAALDYHKLTFPLRIRKWQEGDWFIPLGMKGKKKISDFLIDKKISLNLKKVIFVLLSGDDIVWVIGHRIDDRFKITPQTKQILEIRIR